MEHGRVLTLALDNPPDNAVTPALLEAVDEALAASIGEGGPDVIVLTGRGNVFSKGFDVGVIRSHGDADAHRAALAACNEIVNRLEEYPKPIIAAVSGHCLGAGLELAMACHLRLCVEKARLGLPEIGRGLLPGMGGVPRLARLVGGAKALELTAVGDLITADEAHRIGLVNRVLPRAGFMEAVLAFARALLSVDQALIREIVRLSMSLPLERRRAGIAESMESALRLAPPATSAAGAR